MLAGGLTMAGAGAVIMLVGMTRVFVPEDLAYLGMGPEGLHAINPRLIPLIAHDRAGFGGGLFSCGLMVGLITWRARLTSDLWQALLIAGVAGFGCAIGVHYAIGYLIFSHLAPAWAGAGVYLLGMAWMRPTTQRAALPLGRLADGS